MHNTDLLKGHLPHRVRRDHKCWAIWRNKKSSMAIYEPQTALKPPAVDTDANTPPVVRFTAGTRSEKEVRLVSQLMLMSTVGFGSFVCNTCYCREPIKHL